MLKCCYITANFCIHASKGPVIIMNQINSIYNGPFIDSHSHFIHTYFPTIASNDSHCFFSSIISSSGPGSPGLKGVTGET